MSGKVADLWSSSTPKGPEVRSKRSIEDEEDKEFKGVLREVLDYVMPQMGKREKRQFEAQKIRALGGTADKGEKMPYSYMQKMQNLAEVKRQKTLAEEKTLGVSMSASKHRMDFQIDKEFRKKKEAAKEKIRKREDRVFDLGMGAREKNGMAVISKRAVREFTRQAGR